jgi:hypothetical protein
MKSVVPTRMYLASRTLVPTIAVTLKLDVMVEKYLAMIMTLVPMILAILNLDVLTLLLTVTTILNVPLILAILPVDANIRL